ncbi:hypothetical protein EVAR_69271_1 [Eumeta japonica]|uniref:Uncharacterized protein n=1 Tax=Eumeta variegata TaxID=151549 RepID=A0A4C1T0F0_EUMVA|nr:hypothetical protein EVAR_69271_1 [Eumeta japonica]
MNKISYCLFHYFVFGTGRGKNPRFSKNLRPRLDKGYIEPTQNTFKDGRKYARRLELPYNDFYRSWHNMDEEETVLHLLGIYRTLEDLRARVGERCSEEIISLNPTDVIDIDTRN